MSRRFRPSGGNAFWGDTYLELAVPKDHFLRRLKDLIDWEKLTEGLADCYKGGAEYGPIPYHPAVLFKMLLLSYLYKLSERQTEDFANDSIGARYFLGLGAHQSAPDHSSLSVFKERLLERKGPQAFEELVKGVERVAKNKGISFGRIQVVDATHSLADVDVRKGDERRGRGGEARDRDAAWGSKGRQQVKTWDGKVILRNKFFYGYKAHLSLNAESRLITSVVATAGNETDGKQLRQLVEKDEVLGIKAEVYAGDKGYDDGENHQLLWAKGKKSALCLNEYRTQKKDGNKELWLGMKESEGYWEGQEQRYKIEQKNAEAKRRHGLARCRYLGLAKYAVQSLMTVLVMNLKRVVKLLYGVGFRKAAVARG